MSAIPGTMSPVHPAPTDQDIDPAQVIAVLLRHGILPDGVVDTVLDTTPSGGEGPRLHLAGDECVNDEYQADDAPRPNPHHHTQTTTWSRLASTDPGTDEEQPGALCKFTVEELSLRGPVHEVTTAAWIALARSLLDWMAANDEPANESLLALLVNYSYRRTQYDPDPFSYIPGSTHPGLEAEVAHLLTQLRSWLGREPVAPFTKATQVSSLLMGSAALQPNLAYPLHHAVTALSPQLFEVAKQWRDIFGRPLSATDVHAVRYTAETTWPALTGVRCWRSIGLTRSVTAPMLWDVDSKVQVMCVPLIEDPRLITAGVTLCLDEDYTAEEVATAWRTLGAHEDPLVSHVRYREFIAALRATTL